MPEQGGYCRLSITRSQRSDGGVSSVWNATRASHNGVHMPLLPELSMFAALLTIDMALLMELEFLAAPLTQPKMADSRWQMVDGRW